MTANTFRKAHKAIPFRKATNVIVTFENGETDKGIIEFIPGFFGDAYYEDEDNHDGWKITYPKTFLGGLASHINEYSELGEVQAVEGGWEAEDNTYGKIIFKIT
jgi:hypothetical protein